ncbi:hypothetical protein NQ317_012468 [Molorchus minor]|uniref:OTU domain-containing protein n=1 Tax=Molorchus minor TaxID=1323400 RepID=A0ABQ9JBE8_9CUCU|nr:hypothetical protein NQ317_012468 [Molorchus minor]
MSSKILKKGRNPGAVDNWLDSLGLYRKNVAYDETCLFRAVSEQLFDCQIYHERVRGECLAYARKNFSEFSHHVESEQKWHDHLELLEKHMVICRNIEIDIVSRKYKGSIIYKILYEDVFLIPNVDDIVNAMLYDKNIMTQHELLSEKNKISEDINNNEASGAVSPVEVKSPSALPLLACNVAPFPFKVAKALDPKIYRNIEYDSWGEVRREMRLGEWYYGDDKLILGTRCILNIPEKNEIHDCYIQEIIKEKNKCVVYLTQLAERRLVNYSDLSPENDAKPWPLPYRFSKNLVIAGSPHLPPTEKAPRNIKKRNKEKRRTKSFSEDGASISSKVATSSEPLENVNAYVGVPLQMQSPNESNYPNQESITEIKTEPEPLETVVMTPDIQNTPNRYQWEQPHHWHPYMPPTPDPFVWPQVPAHQSPFNFNLKPMVASAPVTPDVVPYEWKVKKLMEDNSKSQMTQTDTIQYQYQQNENYEAKMMHHERPTLCTTLTPQATPVEMFSPVMSLPPGTPVIYAPAPPEMTDMMMPSPIVYTPPVEMQYISPGPYVYPPTPPAAWYPTGVNSHGFIFPQPRP